MAMRYWSLFLAWGGGGEGKAVEGVCLRHKKTYQISRSPHNGLRYSDDALLIGSQ